MLYFPSFTVSLTLIASLEMETSKKGSLLYVGALYDSFPLTLPEIRRSHDLIIYSDALPASGIYPKLNEESKILDVLVEEGGRFGIISEFVKNEDDGSFEAQLKDNCTLKYFFNTSNVDNDRMPLATVTTLWLHGYVPPIDTLDRLPNLMMVYGAGSCIDDPCYWEARKRLNMSEGSKLIEFNRKCWIPDVLQWISAEDGFDLVGDDQSLMDEFMLCDAPFQFTVDEGILDGEDDDDDGNFDDDEKAEGCLNEVNL